MIDRSTGEDFPTTLQPFDVLLYEPEQKFVRFMRNNVPLFFERGNDKEPLNLVSYNDFRWFYDLLARVCQLRTSPNAPFPANKVPWDCSFYSALEGPTVPLLKPGDKILYDSGQNALRFHFRALEMYRELDWIPLQVQEFAQLSYILSAVCQLGLSLFEQEGRDIWIYTFLDMRV